MIKFKNKSSLTAYFFINVKTTFYVTLKTLCMKYNANSINHHTNFTGLKYNEKFSFPNNYVQ